MNIPNKQTGLTLVELLIALAILGIVMTAVVSLFISTIRAYHTNKAILEVQQNVRHVRTVLNNDLKMVGFEGNFIDFTNDHEFSYGGFTYKSQADNGEYRLVKERNNNGITIDLIYNMSEEAKFTSISNEKMKFEICGKVWDNTPLISNDFEHCVEDTILFRNMYYQ